MNASSITRHHHNYSRSQLDQVRAALLYDRVNTPHGGAENVLLALGEILPQAPLLTSVYHPQAEWARQFNVRPSWLNRVPGLARQHRSLAWLMPLVFESFELSEYELVVSVTSAEAKGVITQPHQLHVCYLLTPPRYLYSHRRRHLEHLPLGSVPGVRAAADQVLSYLEWWDQVAIHRPDVIIPISHRVADRVRRYYPQLSPERLGPVLYPPVSITSRYRQPAQAVPDRFALVVARLVRYKRLDLAILACGQLDVPLVIVGSGPDQARLEKLTRQTGSNQDVVFINQASDQEVTWLMSRAEVLVMPAEEDFGITALEALGQGTPVVAHQSSGVTELLKPDVHGQFIPDSTVPAVRAALKRVLSTRHQTAIMKAAAKQHTVDSFQQRFKSLIQHHAKSMEN